MSARDRAVGLFADTGEVCADSGVLPEAVEALNARLHSRVRLVITGRVPCDEPPDLDGMCFRCGRRLAGPVGAHDTGCMLAFVSPLRRFVVRRWRVLRCHLRILRGRS